MAKDERLAFFTLDELLDEVMRRNEACVIGIFDPQTESSAKSLLKVKGDLAWCNMVVDNLKDFMGELRARLVTQQRVFLQDGDDDPREI